MAAQMVTGSAFISNAPPNTTSLPLNIQKLEMDFFCIYIYIMCMTFGLESNIMGLE